MTHYQSYYLVTTTNQPVHDGKYVILQWDNIHSLNLILELDSQAEKPENTHFLKSIAIQEHKMDDN